MTKPLKYFGYRRHSRRIWRRKLSTNSLHSHGFAFARFLEEKKCDKSKPILLAQDTRASGQKLLASCLRGLEQKNFQALNLGVLSTPALAFSIINQHALGALWLPHPIILIQITGLRLFRTKEGKLSVDEEIKLRVLFRKMKNCLKAVSNQKSTKHLMLMLISRI